MSRRRRPALAAEATRRNREQAARLGTTLRTSRRQRHWTQTVLGRKVGLSQSTISLAERGLGASLSLEAWQRLFLSVDRRLLVDASRDELEDVADAGHLAMQELVLRTLGNAGMRATIEMPTRPAQPARSADVAFVDDGHCRVLLVECWNSFGDIGVAVRATDRKIADADALAAARWGDRAYSVHSVWVVRATNRNRALVARYPEVFRSRFPGSSLSWARALTTGSEPPVDRGLVWCDVRATRLIPWRRR